MGLMSGHSDNRVCWYDIGTRTKSSCVMRNHSASIKTVAFHCSQPLCASVSDDEICEVFRYSTCKDIVTKKLADPTVSIKFYKLAHFDGVTNCFFHSSQPWVFTVRNDGDCLLYCD